eukprot:scaffold12243_cov31-Tisochrysis_lutea.AAC.1
MRVPAVGAPRLIARPIDANAIASLAQRGWCVVPKWLDPPSTAALLADAIALDAPCARNAAVGSHDARGVDTQVRNSRLCALYPPPPPSAGFADTRMALYSAAAALREHLQAEESLGLPEMHPFQTELSYLYYPKGGFYKRHLDVPPTNDGWYLRTRRPEHGGSGRGVRRALSFILYLEESWREEWGGALRIFEEGEPARGTDSVQVEGVHAVGENYTDVVPHGGTLVILRSDRIEHEVLVTKRPRRCIVGWFRSEGKIQLDPL